MEGIRPAFGRSDVLAPGLKHRHRLQTINVSGKWISQKSHQLSAASRFALNLDLRGFVYRVFSTIIQRESTKHLTNPTTYFCVLPCLLYVRQSDSRPAFSLLRPIVFAQMIFAMYITGQRKYQPSGIWNIP